MRKWLALGVQVPFFAMMWAACSGDTQGNPDGGDGSVQDVKTEKKPQETGTIDSGPTCSPSNVNAADLTWVPPRAPDPTACSAQQIADYYTNCLPGSGNSCSTFEGNSANTKCVACINSVEGKDTQYGPLIAVPNNVVYVNIGGCIAIETGDTSATGCGAKSWFSSQCEDKACSDNCVGSTFAEYQKCTQAAAAGTCAPEEQAVCNLADAGNVTAACNLNAKTFQELYASISAVFCGGFTPDGGTSDGGVSDAGTDAGSTDAAVDAPDGD